MAVGVAVKPEWAPCSQCDCVNGVSPIPGKWEIAGVLVTNQCPRRTASSDTAEIFGLYQHYKAGHLLCAGGIADQPAVYLEMMQLIGYWVEKLRE